MDLPLFKNDITNNLEPQKPVVYKRCSNSANSIFIRKKGRAMMAPPFMLGYLFPQREFQLITQIWPLPSRSLGFLLR